ncbi:MAG: hypothetical protein JNN08_07440 [Bryobacterales bacterium]|nr:hypothetical protein [Bryobacterales bacterium]
MKPRAAKCVNFGGCSKADSREIVTVPPGDELTCPECGKMLTATASGAGGRGGKSKVPLMAGIGGLLFVGLLGAFLVWPEPEPPPPPPPQDEVIPAPAPTPQPEPEPQPAPQPDPQAEVIPPPPVPRPKPSPQPVVHEEQPQPQPIPQPDPVPSPPAYSGPSAGTIVWEGTVNGTELVTIQNGVASQGALISGALPGVAVIVQPTDEKKVTIASAPQPADNYQRLVFRVKNKGRTRVSLRWALP